MAPGPDSAGDGGEGRDGLPRRRRPPVVLRDALDEADFEAAVRDSRALAGLIDAGYRGEVRVLLLNTDRSEPFEIGTGDRIAQLVIVDVPEVEFAEADSLTETARGTGGFGSSGIG